MVGWSLPGSGAVPSGLPATAGPPATGGTAGGISTAASELVAHVAASPVSAVRSARAPAASWVAIPTSMPWARYPRSAPGTPAPAAVISTFASRGASGSMSLSRFVIICALASASAPYCGSAAIVRSAFSASPRGSHAALAIPNRPPLGQKSNQNSGLSQTRTTRLPREVFLPELGDAADRDPARNLLAAQLDPADLAGDRLGQVGELDPPDPLVRRDPFPAERHDRPRHLR